MNKKMNKVEEYSSDAINSVFQTITPEELEKAQKKMLLAARIDDGLKAKGWRKIDLAIALNRLPSEITKWLSGTHNFTIDTLFEIEKVLNINLVNIEVEVYVKSTA